MVQMLRQAVSAPWAFGSSETVRSGAFTPQLIVDGVKNPRGERPLCKGFYGVNPLVGLHFWYGFRDAGPLCQHR